MTDKELFEKTEKAFNLNKKNPVIEKVYDKGNFKSLLENTSPIKSNYGANTVSAARGLGRGVAKTGGALAKGLGALGRFAREVIPGTRTSRARTAELQKVQAQARAEELKNMQMRQRLASGDDDDQKKQHKMDKYVEKIYGRNPQFALAYDKVLKGENLNKAEQQDYDEGIKQADSLRARDDVVKGETGAADAKRKEDDKKNTNLIENETPGIAQSLKDKKGMLQLYLSYAHGDEIGDLKLKQLGALISNAVEFNQNELIKIKSILTGNRDLTSGNRSTLINFLPKKAKPKPVDPTTKKRSGSKETAEQKIQRILKDRADNNNRTKLEQIAFENELAAKFKPGDRVQTERGKQLVVYGLDKKTGTVRVRDVGTKEQRPSKRFARDLIPALDLDPEKKKEMAERLKQQSKNEESFEQIVKRYR